MKFFIAAPWRSRELVEGLSEGLIKHGYEVYSFIQNGANLMTGQPIAEELKTFNEAMQSWQDNQNIRKIFDSELEGLKGSDAIIFLEPAGHSSLIEAGIGYGLGKKIFMIGIVERPEVFYLICEKLYSDIPSFLDDVENVAPK